MFNGQGMHACNDDMCKWNYLQSREKPLRISTLLSLIKPWSESEENYGSVRASSPKNCYFALTQLATPFELTQTFYFFFSIFHCCYFFSRNWYTIFWLKMFQKVCVRTLRWWKSKYYCVERKCYMLQYKESIEDKDL